MSSPARKRWAIAATIQDSLLTYSKDGLPLASPAPSGNLSPVEYLLIASAGCLALSIKAAVLDAGLAFSQVQVIASGEKALDPPARLASLQMDVSLQPAFDAPAMQRILAAAQRMCTVGNSIVDAPLVDIRLQGAPSV